MYLTVTFLKLLKVVLMGNMVTPLNEVTIGMDILSTEIDKGTYFVFKYNFPHKKIHINMPSTLRFQSQTGNSLG